MATHSQAERRREYCWTWPNANHMGHHPKAPTMHTQTKRDRYRFSTMLDTGASGDRGGSLRPQQSLRQGCAVLTIIAPHCPRNLTPASATEKTRASYLRKAFRTEACLVARRVSGRFLLPLKPKKLLLVPEVSGGTDTAGE